MISKLYAQLRTLFPILVKLYTPIVILVLLVVFFSLKTGIPIGEFTKDPAVIVGTNPFIGVINPFIGIVSNIGILFWCASASICFFSFAVLQKSSSEKRAEGSFRLFFLFSGFVTSILLLDDLFLFHEGIFPKLSEEIFSNPTISERVVYSGYAMMSSFYILRFRRTILKTEWGILLLAFLFFGASIIMDVFPIPLFDNH